MFPFEFCHKKNSYIKLQSKTYTTLNCTAKWVCSWVDSISANILRKKRFDFSNPILHSVNLSIATGKFPDVYKLHKVFVLYKSNDFHG